MYAVGRHKVQVYEHRHRPPRTLVAHISSDQVSAKLRMSNVQLRVNCGQLFQPAGHMRRNG